MRSFIIILMMVAISAPAGEPPKRPAIPAGPIAKKEELFDGQAVDFLKSPGIGHPTRSKIELGVAGQSGWFDDIKVWNVEPVNEPANR